MKDAVKYIGIATCSLALSLLPCPESGEATIPPRYNKSQREVVKEEEIDLEIIYKPNLPLPGKPQGSSYILNDKIKGS